MAEIRKHRPKTTAIGDLVRANVDAEAVRPTEPGSAKAPLMPDDFDPFFSEEPAQAPSTSAAAGSAAAGMATSGWFSFTPVASQPASESADDEDEDD